MIRLRALAHRIRQNNTIISQNLRILQNQDKIMATASDVQASVAAR